MVESSPPVTDLLMDVLSVPAGRTVSARALCVAGFHLGFPENAVRVALTRLVQQKKIAKVGRGAYAMHPSRMALALDVADWRARFTGMCDWRGDWIAVAGTAQPAAPRAAKRAHERALALRGFRAWKPGLYLRPDNLVGGVEALTETLSNLGLAPGAQLLRLHPLRPEQYRQAVALWDARALQDDYRRLLDQLRDDERGRPGLPAGEAARRSLLIGRGVIARLARDPLLPRELLEGDDRDALVAAIHDYQKESRLLWDGLLSLES
jgi:phenylacetic acid degradation operon negative regulatory protein